MRKARIHFVWHVLLLGLVCLSVPSQILAADAGDDIKILAINVLGNRAISETTILAKIKTKPGMIFSQDVTNEDIKRLYSLGFFSDVEFNAQEVTGGIVLEVVVVEKPVVGLVEIRGNKKLRSGRLRKVMKTLPNQILDYSMLTIDIEEIRKLYEKKGFAHVTIEYNVDVDEISNTAEVLIDIVESKVVKISKINFRGNYSFPDKMLFKLIRTKRDTLFTSGLFKSDVFQEDIENVRKFYRNKGYLDANITHYFDYLKEGRLMIVHIIIEEGEAYLTGNITIEGDEVFVESDLRDHLKMVTDTPFSELNLRTDALALREFYFQHGYMSVRIDFGTILNQETGKIDVTYRIVENELTYVNQIHVSGNVKTKDIVLRREMRLYPGEQFDGSKLQRSKERLSNLGLFESVDFTFEETDINDRKDIVINVKEAKTGEFSFGAGFSSVDEFIGFVQVSQNNFDIANWPTFVGDGQRLVLRAEIGAIRQDYEVSFTEPWIFDYPLLFGFDLYQRSGERSESSGVSYDIKRQGGDIRLGKELTEYLRADATYRLEDVEISDVDSTASPDLRNEEGTSQISSLRFVLTHDTRNNFFNPSSGVVLTGSVEGAGGVLEGDKDFVRYIASSKFYHTLFRDDVVLSLSLKGGLANNYDDTPEVPIYERFFAGGGGSIRGYKERRIGPRDKDVTPVGGEQMLVASVEINFPIFTGVIKGAVFYDIGNVWQGSKDEKIKFENLKFGKETKFLKSGAGVGVRIKTPIGPVKLDYGYPLNDNHEDPKRGHLYFSMSQGF